MRRCPRTGDGEELQTRNRLLQSLRDGAGRGVHGPPRDRAPRRRRTRDHRPSPALGLVAGAEAMGVVAVPASVAHIQRMAQPGDLFFDTNALGDLARSSATADEVTEALGRRRARVIHGPGIAQSIRGEPEKVRRQFQRLASLGLGSAPVGVGARLMLRREARGHAYVATPTQLPSDFHRLFADADKADEFHEVREFFLKKVNSIMHPFPAGRRAETEERAQTRLKETQRRALAAAIGGEAINVGLFDLRSGFLQWVLEREFGEEVAERAAAQPRRHRVHLLAAGMNVLELFAEFMHTRHRPQFPWLYVDKDDRNDINVALAASYAKYLVTTDRGLAGRLEFLASCGLTQLEVLSLDEFLAPDGRRGEWIDAD